MTLAPEVRSRRPEPGQCAVPDDFAAFAVAAGRVDRAGGPGALLLSGPSVGVDPLDGHLDRWGPLPALDGPAVRAAVRASGLDGRGGGGFPLARKLETALLAPGEPLLIVNAGESEPASRKDRVLCVDRPHLVLDGAALAARALGVDEVVVHVHRGPASPAPALARAVAERRHRGLTDPRWRVSEGPPRYVAGEASAVAAFVDGAEARPRFHAAPLAAGGPSGRPTVVSNAETVAHLAVIARLGPDAWASRGPTGSPGTRLVTVAGAVPVPGEVLEITGPATIGEVLVAAGVAGVPSAVLVGGFAGTWVTGDAAWHLPWTRDALGAVGARSGCGLLAVLPVGACAVAETARLVRYLAGESAGQCGPCVAGLPQLARAWAALAEGTLRRRGARRMAALADTLPGSGACAHPDAVVRLLRSALDTFDDDVARHLAGHPCVDTGPSALAVPGSAGAIGVLDTREWR
jgi:NADH:ubiquinone oxidoreductase subunit F (NADH-binding)